MNNLPIISPFYPSASDVSGYYPYQLQFGQPTRWWDSPEKFYEEIKKPGFEKFDRSPETIKKWMSHSNFRPFIKWAAAAKGTDIVPVVLGGEIIRKSLGESEIECIHLILYFPQHPDNTDYADSL
jgi:hypothetical protein